MRGELEINTQKLRNPGVFIFIIPIDVILENTKDTLTQQNTELNVKEGKTETKFS